MLRKTLTLIFCATLYNSACAQKPIIDSLAIENWPLLSPIDCVISNDGNYFSYRIENVPLGSGTLVIHKTDNSWKKEFIGVYGCHFSDDSKRAIVQKDDSLFFY